MRCKQDCSQHTPGGTRISTSLQAEVTSEPRFPRNRLRVTCPRTDTGMPHSNATKASARTGHCTPSARKAVSCAWLARPRGCCATSVAICSSGLTGPEQIRIPLCPSSGVFQIASPVAVVTSCHPAERMAKRMAKRSQIADTPTALRLFAANDMGQVLGGKSFLCRDTQLTTLVD